MPKVLETNPFRAYGKGNSAFPSMASKTSAFLLLLEDSHVLSTLLMKWMGDRFPDKNVAHVSTIKDARDFVESFKVDFFLVDLNLPDGNGMDFVAEIREHSPAARFMLMTNASNARKVRPEVDAVGPVCFMEKPLDLDLVETVLRPELYPKEKSARTGFSAALENADPISIIQLKCLSRATGVIELLNASGEIGRVVLRKGEIVRAETPGKSGIDALSQMVSWKDGAAREIHDHGSHSANELGMGWEMALMEATRLADERAE